MAMRLVIISVFCIFLFNSCQDAGRDSLQTGYAGLDTISPDRWQALSQKRIFFGHKSVGAKRGQITAVDIGFDIGQSGQGAFVDDYVI